MKKYSIGCGLTILLFIAMYLGFVLVVADKPPYAIPQDGTVVTTRSTCAQVCQEWITYTIATDVRTLVSFYTDKGYQCYEHTNPYFTSVFTFEVPYWTCSHPRYERGVVEIGFQVERTAPLQHIRVVIYTFWEPWL